jgi:hypothetical protein
MVRLLKSLILTSLLLLQGNAFAGTKFNVDPNGNVTANSFDSATFVKGATGQITGLGTAGVVHNDASGNLSTSKIINDDVSSSAAIDISKLGAFTNGSRAIVSSSILKTFQESVTTATEIGFLSGVTSAIQTQLNQKQIGLNILSVGVTPNVAGMSLVGPNFNLEAATASFPGVITAGTQTIGGDKTLTGTITALNLSNTNTGDVSLLSFGVSPNPAGLSLIAQRLNLEPADATNPGGVSTGTQTFAGAKTFTSTIAASNLSGTNHGDFTVSAVTPFSNPSGLLLTAGNSSVPQNIALAEADATNPGALSAGTQTIGGRKAFADGVVNQSGTTTVKNAISSPTVGQLFFDTTLGKLCVYTGSAWQTITSV